MAGTVCACLSANVTVLCLFVSYIDNALQVVCRQPTKSSIHDQCNSSHAGKSEQTLGTIGAHSERTHVPTRARHASLLGKSYLLPENQDYKLQRQEIWKV